MPLLCPNCGSSDIDSDAARGDAVCIQCGTVIEENTIVNEVTFAQDATGGSAVVGQFVAATPGVASSGLGFGKESREVAFTNGQRHISQLAQALRLAEHHQEAAQRLFMLAVQHNFIQGRRTQQVIAACLYTVCRREKTPHLLIDFSDVLQTNVYMLGSCFLKFTRLLSLALPIIDPSLYIHRFASKLEFGEKTHLVSMSALRLVQRMKRDWIQTGRRPSGICGAALLIAARVHNFRRTQREVVRVVRICNVTLRQRLTEFAETPMGQLTARELETTDIEALPAADPPSYTRNRQLEALAVAQLTMSDEERAKQARLSEVRGLRVGELRLRLAEVGEDVSGKKEELVQRLLACEGLAEGGGEDEGEGDLLEGDDGAARGAIEAAGGGAPEGLLALPAPSDAAASAADGATTAAPSSADADTLRMPPPAPLPDDPEERAMVQEMTAVLNDPQVVQLERAATRATPAATGTGAAPGGTGGADGSDADVEDGAGEGGPTGDGGGGGSGSAGPYPHHLPASSHEGSRYPDWTGSAWYSADLLESRDDQVEDDEEGQAALMAELNEDLEGLDGEIDGYLITDTDEIELKRRVWERMNGEYLAQQADRQAAKQSGAVTERPRGHSKRQRREAAENRAAGTVAEAVAGELRRNKLSSRINYEVVQILSQALDDDLDHLPDEPGPIANLPGALSPRAPSLSNASAASAAHTPSDRRDFSDHLSVASSYEGNDEPEYNY